MNRKQFIEANGGTCRNWRWSWFFVNEADRTIFFGAWDIHQVGDKAMILSEDWQFSRGGRKQPAYSESREHVRLVEEEGYRLKTLPMVYSAENEGDGTGPSKIGEIIPELSSKSLVRVGKCWYACGESSDQPLPEELDENQKIVEGASRRVSINAYERSPTARKKCLDARGYACTVCGFDFEETYGPVGRHYIHVHHIVAMSEIGREYEVDPVNDLVPICPNCHAMIHSTRPPMEVEQLRSHLNR
jgi:5-methylcytosine-specific restriction protein A